MAIKLIFAFTSIARDVEEFGGEFATFVNTPIASEDITFDSADMACEPATARIMGTVYRGKVLPPRR